MNKLILNNFNNYEYFARHDSDDFSSQDRLKSQIEFLKGNKCVDIVGTAFASFNKNQENLIIILIYLFIIKIF